MDEAETIVDIIQKSFVNDKENFCEIIDVGSATKACLDNNHVSLEKKNKVYGGLHSYCSNAFNRIS